MPTQTPSMGTEVDPSRIPRRGKPRPPDLRNHRRFVRLRRVPVIDVNKRTYRKGDQVVEENLDHDQLQTICRNSQARADKGEYGLVLLGHTTDGGKEIDQPPVVGFLDHFRVGEHGGRPTILSDMFIYKDSDPSQVLRQFPRRSAEIIGLEEPDGYVDALSLIKRAPERDLGLITHYALNHDATRDFGAAVRYRSKSRVYRFHCPPGRFCPEHHEESSHMPVNPRSGKMATHLLDLLKQVVMGIIEEVAEPSGGGLGEEPGLGEPSGMEPSGLEPSGMEPSGLGEPSGFEEGEEEGFEEGEEAEFEEEEGEEEMEPSEPSNFRYRQPAAHGRHERPSRHRHDPSDPSGDPSEPSEPRRLRRHERPSRNAATQTLKSPKIPTRPVSKHKRLDPEGQPKRYDDAGGMGGGGSGTGGSGYPSPQSSSTPFAAGRRPQVEGTKARLRKEREVTRDEPSRTRSRMRKDSERTAVSRYQQENSVLRERVSQLEEFVQDAKSQARQAVVERQIIQLESEGILLDREEEVARLSRFRSDKEVAREVKRMRKRYTRSPVGQPMLPNIWEDVGGAGGPDRIRDLSPQEQANLDTDDQGCEIVGSGIARFAATLPAEETNGFMEERGMKAVSRFHESRKPKRYKKRPATDED